MPALQIFQQYKINLPIFMKKILVHSAQACLTIRTVQVASHHNKTENRHELIFHVCLLFSFPSLNLFALHLIFMNPVCLHQLEGNRKSPICPAPTFMCPWSCPSFGPGLKTTTENDPFALHLLFTCPGLGLGRGKK